MEAFQMERKKTVINALIESEPFSFENDGKRKRIVAAYCRVSTDEDEQKNSYENQVKEWTERIRQKPNYTLYKVYGDEGVTGTDTAQRTGFQDMISDAERGQFDLIMCKSISRFGRNTVITLSTIRHLKEIGVEVYFDNEHMSTFDPKNEFMFTIMSSMAQEESRHISENVKWTFKRLMEKGNAFGPGPYGYCLGKDEEGKRILKIVPEQAEIIRMIYDLYDNGFGVAEIARILEEKEIPTATGKTTWNHGTILDMLKNEAYKGTLILQKTYTVDYIGHKRTMNRGQKQTWIFENAHEPIIEEAQWERVSNAIKNHFAKASGEGAEIQNLIKYSSRGPLSGLIVCGKCGLMYKRRHLYDKSYKEPRIVYQCNGYVNKFGAERCHSKAISENIIFTALADMLNNLYATKKQELEFLKTAFIQKYKLVPIDIELEEAIKLKEATRKRLKTIDLQKIIDEDKIDSLNIEQERLIDNFKKLENKIKHLKANKSMIDIKNNALSPIIKVIKGKKVKFEDMRTFPIRAVVDWIKVIDKENVVFLIDIKRKKTKLDLKNYAVNTGKKGCIFQNTIKIKNPVKQETLNYFVKVI